MSKQEQSSRQDEVNLPLINPNAAGIDIGADRHWVSVPVGRDQENVRSFACFTADLYRTDLRSLGGSKTLEHKSDKTQIELCRGIG
jgi:hypothetical protein